MPIHNNSRDSLGRRLRELRREAGFSDSKHLAKALGNKYSDSAIRKRERGFVKIDREYVEDFCRALSLSNRQRDQLFGLTQLFEIQFDPWRSQEKGTSQLHFEFWERLCCSDKYSAYDPCMIHGLLQTSSYAYEMLRLYGHDHQQALEASQIRVGMGERMLELTSSKAQGKKKSITKVIIVTDEEALYRRIGPDSTMIDQLETLLELKCPENLVHRILPRGVRLTVPMTQQFNLFDSVSATMETLAGAMHTCDPSTLSWLATVSDQILAASVDGKKAQVILERAIKSYRK